MEKFKNNRGQIMLLAVSMIGFAILTSTSIVGYIFLQKIRMATIVVDATKAIYAADAGVECEIYNIKNGGDKKICNSSNNGGSLSFDDQKVKVTTTKNSNPIRSIGVSNNTNRAFSVSWQ
ncbi:hypothetical protein HZB04_03565 [Candidatus Wolfebacteria bacterium]|nr:hypothetical protein [Candidatus Wolfebacteria bacterium]